jgi:hypothetical protein
MGLFELPGEKNYDILSWVISMLEWCTESKGLGGEVDREREREGNSTRQIFQALLLCSVIGSSCRMRGQILA